MGPWSKSCHIIFNLLYKDFFNINIGSCNSLKHFRPLVEYWMDNWTVSDVTGHAGVIGQYLANAIISDKSKWR